MMQPFLRTLGIAALLALAAAPARAEVWLCGKSDYTSAPREGQSCRPMKSNVVCGKGNRYIAPARDGQRDGATVCEKTGSTVSPFVDTSAPAAIHHEPKREIHQEKPAAVNPLQGVDLKNLPGDSAQVQKIFQQAAGALAGN
jgi:hypothetical protein